MRMICSVNAKNPESFIVTDSTQL